MKNLTYLLLFCFVLGSCSSGVDEAAEAERRAVQSAADLFSNVLNQDNVVSEYFTIDNSIDQILEGRFGTIIRVNKNSFVDQSGTLVTDSIRIELKEVLSPTQRAMANLQTVYDGQALESGGMIYLNASAAGNQVQLADSKELMIKMPTDSSLADMSLFEGDADSSIVQWVNPVALEVGLDTLSAEGGQPMDMVFERSHNIKYNVLEFPNMDDIPDMIHDEVSRIAWEGTGLKIARDSSFELYGFTVNFFAQPILTWHRDVFTAEKGLNSYITDQTTSYIFSMNKLGWANIDRLFSDPRTEEVELLTSVTNHADYDYVYITMLTERMYLPGYQKEDNSYSFTHGDYESPQLPVGAKAIIMATAHKDDVVYFDYQTITIAKQQEVSLELAESDLGQIELAISSEI